MEVGSLIALPYYNDGLWLYRVVRTTETRLYVEVVERGHGYLSGPATGSDGNKPYIEKRRHGIPIRDMDHFESAKKAEAEYQQAIKNIKSTAKQKSAAALERYEKAIA